MRDAAGSRLAAVSDLPTTAKPGLLPPEVLTQLQPGLARLMPEIGARMWKAYYAAEARNWELARWQLKEMRKLFVLGNITRPKYASDVDEFLHDDLDPLFAAIERRDWEAFASGYAEAVDAANELHRRWKKPWIRWKRPDMPPPDLDLTPVEVAED